jgi:outer membrane protein TolC
LTAEQQKFDAEIRLAEARYHFILAWITLNSYAGEASSGLIAQVNENFLYSN